MCDTIRINNSHKVIESAGDFEKHYGINPDIYVAEEDIPVDRECCMCQMDLAKFFKENPQHKAVYECGDWYADS